MEPQHPPAWLTRISVTSGGEDAGSIIRTARLKAGLTLAELGRRCGYSASQISRYDRGIQPLTDVTLLRLFAEALAIPHELFGLAEPSHMRGRRHADMNQRLI